MKKLAMWEEPVLLDEALIKCLRDELGDVSDAYLEGARQALQDYQSFKAQRQMSRSQAHETEELLLVSSLARKLKKALTRLDPDAVSLFAGKFYVDSIYASSRREEYVHDFEGSKVATDLKNELGDCDPALVPAIILMMMPRPLSRRRKPGIAIEDLPPLLELIARSATPAKEPLKAGAKSDGRVALVRALARCYSDATKRRATTTIGGPFERAVAPLLKAVGIHTANLKPLIRKALRG